VGKVTISEGPRETPRVKKCCVQEISVGVAGNARCTGLGSRKARTFRREKVVSVTAGGAPESRALEQCQARESRNAPRFSEIAVACRLNLKSHHDGDVGMSMLDREWRTRRLY
jgi:hypothetical protein